MYLRNIRTGWSVHAFAVAMAAAPVSAFAESGISAASADQLGLDRVIVTSSPLEKTIGETLLSTSVLDEEELERRLSGSIGETLRREPGLTSTFFGPGASRPVIRGLAGDRIRVLDNGIGSIDASVTSPDHAVAVEPALAERIEVVRGPATLLYGSSAAGGVVNVIDGRIPTELPEGNVDAAARYAHTTVDDGNELSVGFSATAFGTDTGAVVISGQLFSREADDYEIPGFAESARFRAAEEAEEEEHGEEEGHEEEEEVFGIAENSDLESEGAAFGASYIWENGYFGLSAKVIDAEYGLPGGHGHGEEEEHGEEEGEEEHGEEEEEEGVRINLDQRRYDLAGEINGDFGLFQTARVRIGYADYKHKELESPEEVGTLFSNEGWEGRFELIDREREIAGGALSGAAGFQFRLRDFSAVGEEAFVPPTESDQFGFFAMKEYKTGPWTLELGGRYEHTSHEVTETGFDRSFDGFSVSGGAGFKLNDITFLGVTAFRTERAPATEELFSNGPHLATDAFEIGDPNLNEEVALGVEATARAQTDRFSASINVFYTSYNDFIYETETGEIEDGLPVFRFFGEDADFYGFEAQGEFEIASFESETWGSVEFSADAAIDLVRASLDQSGNDNLPRIPPLSGLFGAEARTDYVDLRAEVEHAAEQDRTTEFELPTDSYTLLNAYVTFKPFADRGDLSLRIGATNLTDEDARQHTSFLKDLAPLPGRNVRISLRGAL